MWDTIKFIFPLFLISVVIITIDQHNKKRPSWKLWAGTALVGCFIYLLSFLAGPLDNLSPGNRNISESNASSGQSTGISQQETETKPDGTSSGQVQNPKIPPNNQQQNPGESTDSEQDSEQKGNSRETAGSPPDMFLPLDEANQDTDFKEFRDDFISAVKSYDLAFLKNHLSSDIRYSFGDNNGISGFWQHWQLNSEPEKSQVWSELAQVLTLGGSFDKDKAIFTAPYVFANFPSTVDGFENVAVISPNVDIHSEPNANSPVVTGVSFKILKLADSKIYKTTGSNESGEAAQWRKVETSAGEGFINEAYIRSPIDYRAQFRQEDGVWKMMFFVAGD
ncbi:MAG: hypothetical protein RO469_00960 [Thermincola sp.]|jgi:hypothetical protein|nr:hypothetical protein [Thermincola sp.]MDT3701552.1 hypothetical protein [Thermincola sp.]